MQTVPIRCSTNYFIISIGQNNVFCISTNRRKTRPKTSDCNEKIGYFLLKMYTLTTCLNKHLVF